MKARVELTLTPVLSEISDPDWVEVFLRAAQWALENPHELLADARRVCHRDFCETLLYTWVDRSEVPDMIRAIRSIGKIRISVDWQEEETKSRFEDGVQLLCSFGRIVSERSIKDKLLVSTELRYFIPSHGSPAKA